MNTKLNVGDWAEVLSKEEILKTLDNKGALDEMPFMPEMFHFCGKRFKVYKRAHKTCDYASPYPYRTRWLESSVHLETRCDGGGHDGCQAACLITWKEAWLKPVSKGSSNGVLTQIVPVSTVSNNIAKGCMESDVWAKTQTIDENGKPKYFCQATQTPKATKFLHWWDVRQYIQDYLSGNFGIGRILATLIYGSYYTMSQSGIGLGAPTRWFYNKISPLWGGPKWPRTSGQLPEGSPTPAATLNLQPGEWVRVKSQEDILKTVTTENCNRGMFWDAELVPYCGKTYQVVKRVSKLIDEKTGKMMDMKTACIILDHVVCQARYSPHRLLCPKEMYPYWREIWLERVGAPKTANSSNEELESATLMTGGVR